MESGHKSGGASAPGGGTGGEGVLCHACGYQYPNGHPSAKQRRAHRKHCGKPASAAAAAEEGAGERDSSELLPGEGGGDAGDGIGASAAEWGGALPGSAPEAGNAVEEGDTADLFSGNGTGCQVIEDKCSDDYLISSGNTPSEITPEASKTDNDDTLTTAAIQYSEKVSLIEDGDPSDSAVSSEQPKDVPTTVLPPEPEDGARFSSENSEYEIQNSCAVPLASNATEGGTSEQTNDVVHQLDGIAVTEEDDMNNTIGYNKSSDDKSGEVDGCGSSCQDDLRLRIGEGHSATVMEEDPYDRNPDGVHREEIPSDEIEPNQQRKPMLTDSFEKYSGIEAVDSFIEKSVGTDDGSLKLATGSCHSETPDVVKPQQQSDSTSETADHLAISEGADNVDEQHYPITEEGIQAISSATVPAVGGKVVPVDGGAYIKENVCSPHITMEDSMQENMASSTLMPSQVDLVELSTSTMAHEINMVDSTNDVDEKSQNEKNHEINEMYIIENFEEKQQNKEADPIPHETNAVFSTDNRVENEQNEEIIAETSYCKISAVQCMSGIEEKEQIEEFIANLANEEINVTRSRGIVEEKQGEIDVKTNREIDAACSIQTTGENNADYEINAGTATDNVEDKMQNEEITTGPISHAINLICSSISEEKTHSEEMTEATMVHSTGNVEEKMYEETTADLTSHKLSVVTSTDTVEEKKDIETSADPTSHEANAAHTSDNVDETKNGEPIVYPTFSIGTIGSIGDVEDKETEETTANPRCGQNSTLQGTDDAENNNQYGDTSTTGPASDETGAAQNTNVIEEREKTEDTASKEISTIESTDDTKGADLNEEIADKEMVTDSDRNHVSLKVLLADKNVETKEKKASTKDRVLSFRRRASKDNASPVKPGSPKAGSGQLDWNSPARLPVEKKPKGRKQQWVPFICCSSVQ